MLRDNLKNGIPTMVEWMDREGHRVVVNGYDTRGMETVRDEVIIFADSVDCHDDRVDGITYFNCGEFDAMWFDAHYFPENMKDRGMGGCSARQRCPAGLKKSIHFSLFEVHGWLRGNTNEGNKALHWI
ncbi:MAG: hypothetical protein WCB46_02435 [Methanoregula sp.]